MSGKLVGSCAFYYYYYYCCGAAGCNRKYKTEKKWLQHMQKQHPTLEPVLPETVECNTGQKRSNED